MFSSFFLPTIHSLQVITENGPYSVGLCMYLQNLRINLCRHSNSVQEPRFIFLSIMTASYKMCGNSSYYSSPYQLAVISIDTIGLQNVMFKETSTMKKCN